MFYFWRCGVYEYKGYRIVICGSYHVYGLNGFIGDFDTEQDAEEFIDTLQGRRFYN